MPLYPMRVLKSGVIVWKKRNLKGSWEMEEFGLVSNDDGVCFSIMARIPRTRFVSEIKLA